MKIPFKPGTLIYPLPAVMVTCGDCEENYNIITIGWTGTICSDPPMCYISVRKERHSHELIMKNKEFVINLTTEDLAAATDWCGVRSGRDYNKFKQMHLHTEPAQIVKAPTFNDSLDQVIENEKANSKIKCMDDLLNSGSTWTID